MVVLRWLRWRSKNGGDCGGGGCDGGEEIVVLFLVMNLNLWVVDEEYSRFFIVIQRR
jgi:hypothetical protein